MVGDATRSGAIPTMKLSIGSKAGTGIVGWLKFSSSLSSGAASGWNRLLVGVITLARRFRCGVITVLIQFSIKLAGFFCYQLTVILFHSYYCLLQWITCRLLEVRHKLQ